MPDETPDTKAEKALKDANRIIAQFFPLIGGSFELFRLIAPLFMNRQEAATFAQKLAELDVKRAGLKTAIDAFEAEFGPVS